MSEHGFLLTSPSFVPDGILPLSLSCDGIDRSPELNWHKPPAGTQSFTLILDDPDAPSGTFTHWVLFDIGTDVTGLPSGSSGIGLGGRNDFHHNQYGGPCPPAKLRGTSLLLQTIRIGCSIAEPSAWRFSRRG